MLREAALTAPVNGGTLITYRFGRLHAEPAGVAALLVVLVLIVATSTTVATAAEEKPPSNLDLMTSLGTQIAEEVIVKIEPDIRGNRIRLKPFGNGEEYQVLDDIFTRILTEKGITAVKPPAPNAPQTNDAGESMLTLEYKVPVFRLSYVNVYRSYLIGGKKVRREANIRMSAKLLAGSGDVSRFDDVSASESDQFSYGDLRRIQEGNYQFVQPEMPGSGWSKIVEPVFVSAIIVGMIYLFFSNQSDS
jgi:hypothetical protein